MERGMIKKKVYVVSKGYHDFGDASMFGEMVYMAETGMNRTAVSNMIRKFGPIISNSEKGDYILMTGMSIQCSIACTLFAMKHGRLNLLIYDAQKSYYLVRSVILDERGEYHEIPG